MNFLISASGNVGSACIAEGAKRRWYGKMLSRSVVDLSDFSAVKKYFINNNEKYDLVVANHGVQRLTTAKNMLHQDWYYVIDNNLSATAFLVSNLLTFDKLNSGALVVTFSSIQANHPRIGRFAYAAAKSGIEGLTLALATEMFQLDGRAISLRVGQMTQPMKGIEFAPDQLNYLESKIPLDWVSPEDVARLCFDLYDQKSLTSSIIDISSGHNISIW